MKEMITLIAVVEISMKLVMSILLMGSLFFYGSAVYFSFVAKLE